MSSASLKTAFEATVAALTADRSRGKRTSTTTTPLLRGLLCETQIGDHRVLADFPVGKGAIEAPTPGQVANAALGSCIAIGCALEAARRDISLWEGWR